MKHLPLLLLFAFCFPLSAFPQSYSYIVVNGDTMNINTVNLRELEVPVNYDVRRIDGIQVVRDPLAARDSTAYVVMLHIYNPADSTDTRLTMRARGSVIMAGGSPFGIEFHNIIPLPVAISHPPYGGYAGLFRSLDQLRIP